MRYLIDTNVLSEAWHPQGNSAVKAKIASIDPTIAYTSVIVLGEIEQGIAKLPPGRRRERLTIWSISVERLFEGRLLPVDANIARRWGMLTTELKERGRTLHAPNGPIAATAFVHDLTLLTRNVKDFVDTEIRVVDPWTTPIA